MDDLITIYYLKRLEFLCPKDRDDFFFFPTRATIEEAKELQRVIKLCRFPYYVFPFMNGRTLNNKEFVYSFFYIKDEIEDFYEITKDLFVFAGENNDSGTSYITQKELDFLYKKVSIKNKELKDFFDKYIPINYTLNRLQRIEV